MGINCLFQCLTLILSQSPWDKFLPEGSVFVVLNTIRKVMMFFLWKEPEMQNINFIFFYYISNYSQTNVKDSIQQIKSRKLYFGHSSRLNYFLEKKFNFYCQVFIYENKLSSSSRRKSWTDFLQSHNCYPMAQPQSFLCNITSLGIFGSEKSLKPQPILDMASSPFPFIM